jgi:hypothetical protein
MMDFVERFEACLEREKMHGQLRMLNFACAAKARKRILTLTRPSRDEPLQVRILKQEKKVAFFLFFFVALSFRPNPSIKMGKKKRKKGCPAAGERTRDLLISFVYAFHHFTAEPQRLPSLPKVSNICNLHILLFVTFNQCRLVGQVFLQSF